LNTLDFICSYWSVSLAKATTRNPVEIPNVSREKDLPELFKALEFKRGVEVGVECGLYSEKLCSFNPALHLYAVDCWRSYNGYRDHVSQSKLEGFYETAKDRLAKYDCTILRDWSVEAAKQFSKESVDFVYVDANHDLANVIKDISAWLPKIRKGGIIAGHDYRLRKNQSCHHHVVQAVKAWTDCYQVSPWFLLGRKDKVPGEVRDSDRSWMWVV